MFDVMLIREFGVEEINAQNVARAFVEGARMVDVMNEQNIIADIDQLAQATPRRDIASPEMLHNAFRTSQTELNRPQPPAVSPVYTTTAKTDTPLLAGRDAISSLFGFGDSEGTTDTPALDYLSSEETGEVEEVNTETELNRTTGYNISQVTAQATPEPEEASRIKPAATDLSSTNGTAAKSMSTITPVTKTLEQVYTIRINGPGIDSQLSVQDEHDLEIVQALLNKIKKQLGVVG
jgi:hypothetical protein